MCEMFSATYLDSLRTCKLYNVEIKVFVWELSVITSLRSFLAQLFVASFELSLSLNELLLNWIEAFSLCWSGKNNS